MAEWGRLSDILFVSVLGLAAGSGAPRHAFAQEAPKAPGSPPTTSSVASAPSALLVVKNESNVDLAFDFAEDGKRVPGCFWVLKGRSTTFALPAVKLRWSYAVSVMQLVGSVELDSKQPKMLACKAWTNRYGDDDAKCTLAQPPETLPPQDSHEALATSAIGFLQDLDAALQKKDKKAIAPLVSLPLEVEWTGKKKGKKRLKTFAQLLAMRKHLALDEQLLQSAKAASAKLRTGADDCAKSEIDWAVGAEALSCAGRKATLSLRATPACSEHRHLDSWTLTNRGAAWRLAAKGLAETATEPESKPQSKP